MSSWYETRIDRQLREAQERGDFDNPSGAGKPLPTGGGAYDDDWWIRGLAEREGLALALPPALALKREVEDLPQTLAKKSSESAVREIVTDLNDRIVRARRGPVEGPPVAMGTVDVERVVALWREARGRR